MPIENMGYKPIYKRGRMANHATQRQLHPELLWEIFRINANPENDDKYLASRQALLITQRSSQVCRLWREVILESPLLWGRVIDLDLLLKFKSKPNNWINLVMRRAGKSDLWIKGYIQSDQQGAFCAILGEYWERIRALNVMIHSVELSNIWTVLERPAPRLEVFKLQLSAANPGVPGELRDCTDLFSNHAPLLRVFYGQNVTLSPQASWLSQLRHISLSKTCFTVLRLLNVLAQVPQVESLTLSFVCTKTYAEHGINHTQTTSLPNLQELVILDTIHMSATFLRHLSIPTGCRIHSTMRVYPEQMSEDAINLQQSLYGPLTVHLSRTTKTLAFQVSDRYILLRDNDGAFTLVISIYIGEVEASAKVHCLRESIVDCALSSLSGHNFLNVVKLELSFNAFLFPLSRLQKFLLSFSGAEVVEATLPTLEVLLSLRKNIPPALPSLRKLLMVGVGYYSVDLSTTSPISEFIAWRKEIGFPIEELDLTLSIFRNVNAECLENMTGMKVTWRRKKLGCIREYICGTGNPENLCRQHIINPTSL